MPGIDRPNIDKYCSRAVGLGLMHVDRAKRPKAYIVQPDWREKISQFRPHRPTSMKRRQPKPAIILLAEIWKQ